VWSTLYMASSSRSNRPAHSLLQPSKRQPQSSKNSTPPSVSFIFAEPEQGAPLDPASRAIASTRSDTFSIHSTDNVSICSRRLASKHSISSLRTFGSPIRESDEAPQSVLPKVVLGEDPSPRTSVDSFFSHNLTTHRTHSAEGNSCH
jgi:hypothetical protein